MTTTVQEPTPNRLRDDVVALAGAISETDANCVLIVRQKDGKLRVHSFNLSTLLSVALMSEAEVMVIKNYLVPPEQLLPKPAPAPTDWIHCGKEYDTVTLPGHSEVRYGANGKFATKVLSGTFTCSNETFGDPIDGVPKECWYRPVPTPGIAKL